MSTDLHAWREAAIDEFEMWWQTMGQYSFGYGDERKRVARWIWSQALVRAEPHVIRYASRQIERTTSRHAR